MIRSARSDSRSSAARVPPPVEAGRIGAVGRRGVGVVRVEADAACSDDAVRGRGGGRASEKARAHTQERAVSYTHLTLPTICSV
eukprot:6286150-Prymnesium_polylepis.1